MKNTQDLLSDLAALYEKTQGGCFQIYRSKRRGEWMIRVQNEPFEGKDINVALKKAIDYIKQNRKKTGTKNEYTLFR